MKKTQLLTIIIGLFFACEIVAQVPDDILRTSNFERTTDGGSIIDGYWKMNVPSIGGKSESLMQSGLSDFTKSNPDSSNVTLISRALYGPTDCVVSQGTYAYIGTGGAFLIFDCSNPDTSILTGSLYLYNTYGSGVKYIYVKDDYAYIANSSNGLWIIDVSNPTSTIKVSEVPMESSRSVFVQGDYAYVTGNQGLSVIDVSDPVNPQIVGSANIGKSYGICVEDSFAYICSYPSNQTKLTIMDVSNPSSPQVITNFSIAGGGLNVKVYDGIAYIAAGSTGLLIVDVSDPANPCLLSTYTPPGWNQMWDSMMDVAVSGSCVYLSTRMYGFWIVDVFDPQNPITMGNISDGFNCRSISVSGSVAYSACDIYGFSAIDVSNPASPVVTSLYKTGGWCSDVALAFDGNYAYVCTTETPYGIRTIDISDIHNPHEVASYQPSPPTNVYNSFLKDTLLYVSCMFAPIRVLNISDPLNLTEVAIYSGFEDAYNVQVMDTLLYATGSENVYILNVSDPVNPSLIGSYNVNGEDIMGLKVVDINGRRYAFVAAMEVGVLVIDFTDPANPTMVASIPCNNGYDVDVSGNYLYISERGFFNVVAGGMTVVDITEPTTPIVMGSYSLPEPYNAGADIAVSGNYVYLAAWYKGVRVIDVSNPNQPIEVGWYHIKYGEGVRGIALKESGSEFPYIFGAHTFEGLWIYQFTGSVGIEENNTSSVKGDVLFQSYPNPFSSNTTISYQLKEPGKVMLNIYNIQGQLVNKLVDEYQESGKHSIIWNGNDGNGKTVPNGTYLYKLQTDKTNATKKMFLLK